MEKQNHCCYEMAVVVIDGYIGSIEEVKSVSFTACTYSLSSYLNFYILFILFKRKGKYTNDSEIIQGFTFDKPVIISLQRLINNGCKR